jgi:hypothetical protein
VTYPEYEIHQTPRWSVIDGNGRFQVHNAEYCKVELGVLFLYDKETDMYGSLVKSYNKDNWKSIEPVTYGAR